MKTDLLIIILLASIALLSSGAIDLDWQLVSYRYSAWHRGVDYWEYNPHFRMNWWDAYMLNVLRIVFGAFLLGFCVDEIRHLGKKPTFD